MTALLVAFVAAISISVWAYTRLQRRTGYGNSAPDIKGTAIVFVIAFVVILSIGLTIFK